MLGSTELANFLLAPFSHSPLLVPSVSFLPLLHLPPLLTPLSILPHLITSPLLLNSLSCLFSFPCPYRLHLTPAPFTSLSPFPLALSSLSLCLTFSYLCHLTSRTEYLLHLSNGCNAEVIKCSRWKNLSLYFFLVRQDNAIADT